MSNNDNNDKSNNNNNNKENGPPQLSFLGLSLDRIWTGSKTELELQNKITHITTTTTTTTT